MLDVVLSLLVEAHVVLFWHGVWSLEDLYSDQYGLTNEETAWLSFVSTNPSNCDYMKHFP